MTMTLFFVEAVQLTQLDSVGFLPVSSALLHQGGKGHRQDVFALPCALTSPGYLGQLQKQDKRSKKTNLIQTTKKI